MAAGTEDRDVGQKLLDAIDQLRQNLISSIEELKKNEITAAWGLVDWITDTEKELIHLDEE